VNIEQLNDVGLFNPFVGADSPGGGDQRVLQTKLGSHTIRGAIKPFAKSAATHGVRVGVICDGVLTEHARRMTALSEAIMDTPRRSTRSTVAISR